MYNRDFGGIKSEGQLYNYEKEYNESRARAEREYAAEREYEKEAPEENTQAVRECGKKKGIKLDFLRDMRLDDLILIAIGVLLLLDSDGDNDMFVLIIAFLLFF